LEFLVLQEVVRRHWFGLWQDGLKITHSKRKEKKEKEKVEEEEM
jgi:hypothetical protein